VIEALGLPESSSVTLALMLAQATDPSLHEILLSLTGDPVVKHPTRLALAELQAGCDFERAGQRLASLVSGGDLEVSALLQRSSSAEPGGRAQVALEPLIQRYLAGEDPTQLWSEDKGPGRLVCGEDETTQVDDAQMRPLRRALRQAARQGGPLKVLVSCPDARAIVQLVARQLAPTQQPLLVVDATAWEGGAEGRDRLRRASRDATILGALLYIGGFDALIEGARPLEQPLFDIVAEHQGAFILGAKRCLPSLYQSVAELVQVALPSASREHQIDALGSALGGSDSARRVAEVVAPRYTLELGLIDAASRQVRACAGDTEVSSALVSQVIRGQLETHLGEFAEVVSASRTLADLELDDEGKHTLRELLAAYTERDRILDAWGFGEKISYARGVSALFHGPPGTGKTMSAAIIARELGTDVYKVDLSRVVDKYIGETEKHLGRIFDEAERSQVVLLFDEADSLFSQRTEVSRSTDRYANMEVNFLLQRLEHHEGIVILTTNHAALIDPAFKRRIRYHVHFPMPDEHARARLWANLIPNQAPIDVDVDFEYLGSAYEMSGGHIRNAIVRAAYSAADAQEALGESRLVEAADVEYRAMGKLVRAPNAGD
jgi:hypothetical protein